MVDPEVVIRELLVDAMSEMERASCGASVCSFTKAGVRAPALKYAEGRWAALRELRSRGASSAAAAALGAAWREHLAEAQEHDASSDWLAYRSGGVDALAEVTGRLDD